MSYDSARLEREVSGTGRHIDWHSYLRFGGSCCLRLQDLISSWIDYSMEMEVAELSTTSVTIY
jgi:hypothetical protein